MKSPARLLAVLAFAAAVSSAAASERFVPADPAFVVANVSETVPDDALRPLVDAWRRSPDDGTAVLLATELLARAHERREPMFVGRAEAVLATRAARPGASGAVLRLHAQTLQYRHDFTGAARLLDAVLDADPRDQVARTLRASVRLVRGDFPGARVDCAQLAGTGGAQARVGFACLAEAMAGAGDIGPARALLAAIRPAASAADAYLLAVRGELGERAGDPDAAIADYSAALALAPHDDSIRAALSDALAARGRAAEAFALLEIDRPAVALRVRRALVAPADRRPRLAADAAEWLALESARHDARHDREGALLALGQDDAARALAAARANFQNQRELSDVRVLARAAIAAGDRDAQNDLRRWLLTTGFRDVVTERILGVATGG